MDSRRRTDPAPSPLLAALVLSAAALAGGCDRAQLPPDHHLAQVRFPLLEDFEAQCEALLNDHAAAGMPETQAPAQVQWAATLDEAFERATREDKPVLIATLVRENGDAHCDV